MPIPSLSSTDSLGPNVSGGGSNNNSYYSPVNISPSATNSFNPVYIALGVAAFIAYMYFNRK